MNEKLFLATLRIQYFPKETRKNPYKNKNTSTIYPQPHHLSSPTRLPTSLDFSKQNKPQYYFQLSNGEAKALQNPNGVAHHPSSSQNVLRARRGVIRMLIIVVCTFALCNLPLHARKMWQHWSSDYKGNSNFSALLTPLTCLVTYFNSGLNPLLYAFLSKNFRR